MQFIQHFRFKRTLSRLLSSIPSLKRLVLTGRRQLGALRKLMPLSEMRSSNSERHSCRSSDSATSRELRNGTVPKSSGASLAPNMMLDALMVSGDRRMDESRDSSTQPVKEWTPSRRSSRIDMTDTSSEHGRDGWRVRSGHATECSGTTLIVSKKWVTQVNSSGFEGKRASVPSIFASIFYSTVCLKTLSILWYLSEP